MALLARMPRQILRRASLARRTYVCGANLQAPPHEVMPRNKYESVLEGEFPLVCGGSLPEVRIQWEQWGDPTLPGDRTILVMPSFSHSSHAASNRDDTRPGWWQNIIGPGKAINTSYFRVICASVLGSPFGATSPLSVDPRTGERYRGSFPQITPADMAACHAKLLDDLKIDRVHTVVGGSMGGMQAVEFAAQFPDRVQRLIGISCTAQTTPGSVAFRRVQRLAIMSDPKYNDGNYETGSELQGMKIARELGMTVYRSREEFDQRFNWNPSGPKHFLAKTFDVESYMDYQANKFSKVFDPNCYLLLSKAMDLTNVGHGYASLAEGVGRIKADTMIIGVKQDLLVPLDEQRMIVNMLQSYNHNAELVEIDSKFGHDAMFHSQMQADVYAPLIGEFVERDLAPTLMLEKHRYSTL